MNPYESPSLWRGDELAARPDWQHVLTDDEIAEIDTALRECERRGKALEEIDADDFPLPELSKRLAAVRDSLINGSGSYFLRGLPMDRYDLDQITRIFWGVSRRLGTPISQSAKGEHIFHVRDAGFKEDDKRARGPNTKKKLSFHCDRCDVIGFFCFNRARRGGENYLVSSIAIHNEILKRRPDLLEVLYQPFYYKTHNVDTANPEKWCHQPIFAIQEGCFIGYILRVLIDRAYELPELPDMTPAQKEALDLVEELCMDPSLNYKFLQEPGDMLFVNNFTNFHSRTEFEDWDEPEKKRLLLRIWLSMPNSHPLPPSFAGSFGKTGAGEIRGGIHPAPSGEIHPAPSPG